MNEMYFVKNNVEKVLKGSFTNFLDLKYQNLVKKRLNNKYNILSFFDECEHVIFYKNEIPDISLYEIKCKNNLSHMQIMGSIFSLKIDESLFGDIIVDDNKYYIYFFSKIENYVINNFRKIGKYDIELDKKPIDFLKNYKRKYELITIISSSERIDSVVSKITNINRKEINNKIKNGEILVKGNIISNNSYILKQNDIFSIRKYGKYIYIGVDNYTKKGNLIIKCKKYI